MTRLAGLMKILINDAILLALHMVTKESEFPAIKYIHQVIELEENENG